MYATLWLAPNLTRKYRNKLEQFLRDKPSSLLASSSYAKIQHKLEFLSLTRLSVELY
jgi:hypothetical protein